MSVIVTDYRWNADKAGAEISCWPQTPVAGLVATIYRIEQDGTETPVRNVAGSGGYLSVLDLEAPLNQDVAYRIRTNDGVTKDFAIHTKVPQGGIWVKDVIGNMAVRCKFMSRGDRTNALIGGTYDTLDGEATMHATGTGPDELTIVISTRDRTANAKIDYILKQGRALFIQHAHEGEIVNGFYSYQGRQESMPIQYEGSARRDYPLSLKKVRGLAGILPTSASGTTWGTTKATGKTWAEIKDTKLSWFDFLRVGV